MRRWGLGLVAVLAFAGSLAWSQDEGGGGGDPGTTGTTGGSGDEGTMEVGEGTDWSKSSALQGDLADALQGMVKLLDEKKYEDFLKNSVDPDELASVLQQRTLQELASGFAGDKAQTLRGILVSLRNKIPVYTSDGLTATFTIDRKGTQLRFRKVKDVWYMKNH